MLGTITITVGQRESEDVREKDRAKEMTANAAVAVDITKDGQEEAPEIMDQIPPSESNVEEMAQPSESQANDVGFKKVFKFVGFKFTVKKDKNEKSDTVQLLTVKKDEGEGPEATVGAGDHQEPSMETGESASKESELKQSTEKPEDVPKQAQSSTEEIPLQAESGQVAEEEAKDEEEEKREKEPTKSAESPTSPVGGETASSFRKFFTHGWAGWRKKTSFKKPKEDDLETSEKKKEQEAEKVDEEENEKTKESPSEQAPASEQQELAEGTDQARLSADYEKVELPLEDQFGGLEGSSEEKCAPLATEVFDEKIEAHQEVVAEVHVSTAEKMVEGQEVGEETEGGMEEMGESLPPEKPAETKEEPQESKPAEEVVKSKGVCVSGGDHTQLMDLSPDEKMLPKHPEGVVSEVEMLSSQERIKVQGSPLKKLFSSSGLKKLSGKKQKGKRGGGGDEEPENQQVQTESPESADEQKGESSASSPEELEEITSLEKGLSEVHQEGEAEEGTTSDGEKKREGITPWASFKKMVTPKKRVRRLSESDKEEEVDKVKSATLSSTESTGSEMQEVKTVGDEQKPEEPKRKVDTSVSWEALICVGSSKKRARKASSSDDEGGPRTVGGDGHKVEEASKDKEAGTEAVPASTQEHDQAQGSSSPEPAGSPTEGEGVSTWESFKRLVTPRKKSKSKLEEKTEDSGIDQLASDIEPSKEESWVSIKKFIPGRRKKRPDGKQEQATAEDVGPTEINDDDPDVPAVVPLSEYDAVEREKMEVREAQESEEGPQLQGAVYVSEELSKTLVHTVSVAVIDGTRAVTSAEERSPSWISASVTEPLERAEDEATPSTEEVTERDIIAEETPAVTQTLPEGKEAHDDDTVISEVEFTSEAVTAAEATEGLHAEEVTEASGAEETTDMVSAVSQLTDSADTTEEATPVQEVEGGVPDREVQERQTQAILRAAAEKVKGESQAPATQTIQRAGPKALEKVEEVEEDSEVLAVEKERDVVLEEPRQGAEAEHSAQGSEIVQSAPESLEEVADTTCQAVEPEQLTEQAAAPESSETLTDSDTNGSTPLADSDTPDVTQPDEAIESQDSRAIATDRQSQVTEVKAAPAQEGPSTPPNSPPQEEHGGKPGSDILEPTQPELSVEAELVLAKTEVGPEAGHFDDENVKDGLCVEGPEVSAHTGGGPGSQEKMAVGTRDGEMMLASECQENEKTKMQRLSPEKRKMGTDVEKEKMEPNPEQVSEDHEQKMASPEREEAHLQPIQTADMSDSERGKAVSSPEGSPCALDQDKAGCIEVQVQSSDPQVTQTAVPLRKVAETVKISETDESLECVGTHSIPAERPSGKGDSWTLQHGEDTVPSGPESRAESVPGTSADPENTLHSDLQGEISASQTQRSDEDDEQVGGPGKERAAREGVLETEPEILELRSKSSKFVQNIIQTAVDQFAHTETVSKACASDLQTQVLVIQADSQGAQQMLDKEESGHQVSAQDEAMTAAAQEGLTLSDISKGMSETSEKINMLVVESARVKDQACEEVIFPLGAEGDGNGAKPVPGDDCAKLGENVEKLPSESKDQRVHTADSPQCQSPAQAELDASGNLTKESPDTNGPKLTEEGDAWEVGIQEGKMPTESVKEIKPQTEENLQEPEGDSQES